MLVVCKNFLKDKQGFTMLELMLAILIIGVLAAVAMPVYSNAVQKSKISRAQADLRTLESALSIYYAEKGEYPAELKDLTPDYIKEVPESPWNSDTYKEDYSYKDGQVYLVGTSKNGIGSNNYLYASGIKNEQPTS